MSSNFTFRNGVHPAENKNATSGQAIERMPFVPEYIIPLSQHIGAPAKAIVEPGMKVFRGQMIAKPGGFVSTAHHSPVDGEVIAIERRPHPNGKLMESIIIKTDPYSSQRLNLTTPPSVNSLNPKEVADHVQNSGMVGLGGAAFPSHVKLMVPEGKKVKFVVLNGCECEPFLTCDHRLMLEYAEDVVLRIGFFNWTVGC